MRIVKDFIFSIVLDDVTHKGKTLYIPQIYFGDKMVWADWNHYADKTEATEVAEARLMEMMSLIFDVDNVKDSLLYANMMRPIG